MRYIRQYNKALNPLRGHYRINGTAFIYSDRATGRTTNILGYPTYRIAQLF
jgi:hypothetical protein